MGVDTSPIQSIAAGLAHLLPPYTGGKPKLHRQSPESISKYPIVFTETFAGRTHFCIHCPLQPPNDRQTLLALHWATSQKGG